MVEGWNTIVHFILLLWMHIVPHPPQPVSNCSSFIPHIYSFLARFSKHIRGNKPGSLGISFIPFDKHTKMGGCRECRKSNLHLNHIHWRCEDTCILFLYVWCSVYLCLLITAWAGQSQSYRHRNYISHWDYKDIGQEWQAPVHAEPQGWREKKSSGKLLSFFIFASVDHVQIKYLLPSGCSGFTLPCQESWFRENERKQTEGSGENKNPKIYIYMFIFIYIYIFTRYVSTKKENTQISK